MAHHNRHKPSSFKASGLFYYRVYSKKLHIVRSGLSYKKEKRLVTKQLFQKVRLSDTSIIARFVSYCN